MAKLNVSIDEQVREELLFRLGDEAKSSMKR